MTPQPARRPWSFAAVCVMVLALTLLLFGLHWESVIQLVPGYVAAYLLIGACIFGPAGKPPSLLQAVAFLLPGALLAPLAPLNLGFWAGGWTSAGSRKSAAMPETTPPGTSWSYE